MDLHLLVLGEYIDLKKRGSIVVKGLGSNLELKAWGSNPEQTNLVLELLSGLHSDGEKKEDIIDPGDDTLGLVSVELGDPFVVDDVVHGKDQLPTLEVKAQSQVTRQSGNQGFLEEKTE